MLLGLQANSELTFPFMDRYGIIFVSQAQSIIIDTTSDNVYKLPQSQIIKLPVSP